MASKVRQLSTFAPGDHVFYARAFLKSVCAEPTDSWWSREGVVDEVRDDSARGGRVVVRVKWEPGDEPVSILAQNLVKKGDRWKEDR